MVFDRLKVSSIVQKGLIAQAVIRQLDEDDCSWVLEFELTDGRIEPMTRARKSTPKCYKSLDAALNDAHTVGLRKAVIEMT